MPLCEKIVSTYMFISGWIFLIGVFLYRPELCIPFLIGLGLVVVSSVVVVLVSIWVGINKNSNDDDLELFKFLWYTYAIADPEDLTPEAQALRLELLKTVQGCKYNEVQNYKN